MPSTKVNYDRVAPTYNQRFSANPMPAMTAALRQLVEIQSAQRVLEVGCGTGQWLSGLVQGGRLAAGLDFSLGMLHQAQARASGMDLVQGKASALPCAGASFDLVYCVNALHHFSNPQEFIQEARQVLRPGGRLAIVGMNPHGHYEDWYVYQYFPGTYATDLARFPVWETVEAWLASSGFHPIERQPVVHINDCKTGRGVLEDPFLQKDSTSQLILLSQAEYAAGIERIHKALQVAEQVGRELIFPVNLYLDMITARAVG